MTTISIIVPVHNAEAYLKQCIESILNQTFQDFELLLIDDGSVDNSFKICMQYAQKDDKVRCYHQLNAGVSAARNKGIEMACGEFIAFVDSDDYLDSDLLEKLHDAIKSGPYDLARCSFRCVGPQCKLETSEISDMIAYSRIQLAQIYYKNFNLFLHANVWGKLYKRLIITSHSIRFKNNVYCCEDRIFNIEYARQIDSAIFLKYAGYNYVDRGNISLTRATTPQMFEGTLLALTYEKEYFYDLATEFNLVAFSNTCLSSLAGCLRCVLKNLKLHNKINFVRKTLSEQLFSAFISNAKVTHCLRLRDIIYIATMKTRKPFIIYMILSLISILMPIRHKIKGSYHISKAS